MSNELLEAEAEKLPHTRWSEMSPTSGHGQPLQPESHRPFRGCHASNA